MNFRMILLPFFWMVGLALSGQGLMFYADAMVNADLPEHRRFAASKFEPMFMQSLQDTYSFDQSLDALKWLVVSYPPDSTFRIVSWQIDLGASKYAYRGIIQKKDNNVKSFSKSSGDLGMALKREIAWQEWQGGIIYDVKPLEEDMYILLTFRQLDQYTKLKTAEVIRFDEDEATLGFPVFQTEEGGEDYAYRMLLEYSADSYVTLNYVDESQQLVFDHLIQVMGRMPGQGSAMVPDGSYRAYMLENGKMKLIDKLYHEVLTTPPRSGRDNTKDLFGRTKN